MTDKKLYLFEDYSNEDKRVLLLTDEQLSVFCWLIDNGWDMRISLLNDSDTEEISTDTLLKRHGFK